MAESESTAAERVAAAIHGGVQTDVVVPARGGDEQRVLRAPVHVEVMVFSSCHLADELSSDHAAVRLP